MTNRISSQTLLRVGSVTLPLLLLALFFSWTELVVPIIKSWLEHRYSVRVFELPEFLAFSFYMFVGVAPPLAVSLAVYGFAYFRWFIPNRGRIVQEQLLKLSNARRAMSEAASHIQTFEEELQRKSAEAEVLRAEVDSLKSLSQESATELEKKIRAMQTLSQSRIWFERAFAFFVGILSSIAANYIWIVLQPKP
jgi:hypothetical protein